MRYRIWYGICNLFNRKIMTLITTVMFAVSFVVIEYAGIIYLIYHFAEWQAKDVLAYPYDTIYNVNLSKYNTGFCGEDDRDRIISFLDELGEVEGIRYSGTFYEDNVDADINKLFISRDLLAMCGIDADWSQEKTCFAGADLKLEVGSEIVIYDSDDWKFEIAGILDGARFIGSDYFDTSGVLLELDDYVVVPLEDIIAAEPWFVVNALNNVFYVLEEGADSEAVGNRVLALAGEHDLDVFGINSADDMFEQMAKDAFEDAGGRYLMPFLMMLCACITMVVSALYSIHSNRKDMGIMLSNGMTRRDLMWIIQYEISIKMILAFVFSLVYTYFRVSSIDVQGRKLYMILLPAYIAFFVCSCVLTNLIPVLNLRKQLPKNMMGDSE